MKKVMFFLLNCMFAESHAKPLALYVVVPSLALGILTGIPQIWMGHVAYGTSFLSIINPYFFTPFVLHCILFCFVGAPFLYHVSLNKTSDKWVKFGAVLLGLVPGCICVAWPLVNLLQIPPGWWNIGTLVGSSFIYIKIFERIFRRSFAAYYPTSELA